MKIHKGVRCDGCNKVDPEHPLIPNWETVFKKFTVAQLVQDGKGGTVLQGIAKASTPNVPEPLHACSSCEKKIKKAFQKMDPKLLPSGPLRRWMERKRSQDQMRGLTLH